MSDDTRNLDSTAQSTALSPAAAGRSTEVENWRQRYIEARDALYQFNYPPDPKLLREIANEIDCGSDCEHGHTEWDTNAHVCSRSDRGECAGEKTWCLRQFADAIDVRSRLNHAAAAEAPVERRVDNNLRALVIEECAKVAWGDVPSNYGPTHDAWQRGYNEGRRDAARDIRSLKGQPAAASEAPGAEAVKSSRPVEPMEPVAWRYRRKDNPYGRWWTTDKNPRVEPVPYIADLSRCDTEWDIDPLALAHPPAPAPEGDVAELIARLFAAANGWARDDALYHREPKEEERLLRECASALSSSQSEIGRLREALKPFAEAADRFDIHVDAETRVLLPVIVGDLDRARDALLPISKGEGNNE